MKLTGKRNKQRTAYITGGALEALRDWLTMRGNEGGALFVAINKGGKLDTSKGINSQAIYSMLLKRAQEAHIKEFSLHDMRRTFVSDLLEAGADITAVAKIVGYSNVLQTTARYNRRPEEAKRKALNYFTFYTLGNSLVLNLWYKCLCSSLGKSGQRPS